jgi:hypothetical protein
MKEGICLRAQLRPVWEKVSLTLGKNPRSSCLTKNSDIQKKNQGTEKKILIFMGNIYLINHFYRKTLFLDVIHFHSIFVFKLYFFKFICI